MTSTESRRWIDVFPWVAGTSSGEDACWTCAVDPPDSQLFHLRVDALARVLAEGKTQWPLGQIFIELPLDAPLERLPFSVRSMNVLTRHGCRALEDLQELTVADVFDWRNVGAGTVQDILTVLTSAAAEAGASPHDPVLAGRSSLPASDTPKQHFDVWSQHGQLQDDLVALSQWSVMTGNSATPLLYIAQDGSVPPTVQAAHRRVMSMTASDFLEEDLLSLDIAGRLNRMLRQFSERELFVLRKRFAADVPAKLDALGKDLGVTRERVRQIETKARIKLNSLISPGGELEFAARAVRERVGSLLPLSDLLIAIPALSSAVVSLGQPAWRVLDRIDNAYEIEDGWCAAPTLSSKRAGLSTRLDELANDYGIVELHKLDAAIDDCIPDVGRGRLKSWIDYCGYFVDGQLIFTRTRSIQDRVCSLLFVEQTPMASDAIVATFEGDRSATSIRNAMAIDVRLVRIDRDNWALAEWGQDPYRGIRDAIRSELAVSGAPVHITKLQEILATRYNVSRASVATYASTSPFRTADGYVSEPEHFKIRSNRAPSQTRRLYRNHDSWCLRISVTADHARGSGFSVPVALAELLDLKTGETLRLPSAIGEQPVYWNGSQPSLGSIRRILLDQDIDVGQQVFLRFRDSGKFEIEPLNEPTGFELADVQALVGIDQPLANSNEVRFLLANAIGLDNGSSVSRIVEEYQVRGEPDIAEMITRLRGVLTDAAAQSGSLTVSVDELMDLL
ncbi:sigma factor-like helix-turn-helix DNA-binding protein [Rhodococcus fascians]|nr:MULTISPECIES: sigma factor-like helix-turn-helix DNA-binding protein [Rhodococcus]MDJ0427281.1 sigma factor-like helix-turn-helix DNA-binding protein [Rhodococcus fascians]